MSTRSLTHRRPHHKTGTCNCCSITARKAKYPNEHWVYEIKLCPACEKAQAEEAEVTIRPVVWHGEVPARPTLDEIDRQPLRFRRRKGTDPAREYGWA